MDKRITSDNLIDIEHHFKVLAGPGAGKTHWLINHIKNVLHNSKRLGNNRKICCITYTNNAVNIISSRLGTSSNNVEISTIHSFLYKHIVKPYLMFINEDCGLNIEKVDGHDEDIISNFDFLKKLKKETKQNWITENSILINGITRASWKFKDNSREELEFKPRRPVKFNGYNIANDTYTTYKKLSWDKGVLHHDDVLYFAFNLIKENPFILNIIRAKFPYFFIDEFQDSNPIQVEIVKLIGKKETIVGLIGDEAQSIYGFQGANIDQLKNFNLYSMQEYKMQQNRRSSKQIVNLLNHIRKNFIQECYSQNDKYLPVLCIGNPIDITNKFKEHTNSQDIAIIARNNIEVNFLSRGKNKINIPENCDSNGKRKSNIQKTIKSVNFAKNNNFNDAIKELSKIRSEDNEILDKSQSIKLLKILMNNLSNNFNLPLITYCDFLCDLFSSFNIKMPKVTRGNGQIFYSGCIYSDYESHICNESINEIHKTIHKTKGCEYNNVLLVLGDEKDLDFLITPNLEEEEQRIKYVAISRAKHNLWIACTNISEDKEKQLLKLKDVIDFKNI